MDFDVGLYGLMTLNCRLGEHLIEVQAHLNARHVLVPGDYLLQDERPQRTSCKSKNPNLQVPNRA